MSSLTVGLLLFPGFEVLDMAGPIEVLNCLTDYLGKKMTLYVIASSLDPISPGPLQPNESDAFLKAQKYLPTHTPATVPSALDILLIPGGVGAADKATAQFGVDFVRQVYAGYGAFPPIKHLFSVCNGAMLLAWAGVLDGQRATTNKAYWPVITATGPKTHWVGKARWVTSGRIWTTSGVSAGIDGMLALAATLYGEEAAQKATAIMEHTRVASADEDPWAEHFGCKDVEPTEKV